MLWWTASKWTGHSKRESTRCKPECEREGNPNSKKAWLTAFSKDDLAEPLHVMRRRLDAYCSSRHLVVSGQCNLGGDSGGRALVLSQ